MARILLGALAAFVMLAGPVSAQPYPTKTTIRIIAPVPPGGNVDLTARAVAPGLQRSLGQTVIVENKTGAAGNVGAEYVARSAPDGYTLLLTGTFITISTTLYEKLGYDGRKDFTNIARLVSAPNILVVSPNSPFKTVADLVAHAKANPGKLNFASNGMGTTLHLTGEMFKRKTGIDMVHVPFKSYPDSVNSVMNGETHLLFDSLPVSLANLKAGKLRPLAITDSVRAKPVPDVPTMAEAGVSGVEVRAWFGIAGPAGMPADIVARLEKALQEVTAAPEFVSMSTTTSMDTSFMGAKEFGPYFLSEIDKWADVIKAAGVKAE